MKPQILFLCTGNSCRSQMAEAWGRALFGERYRFASAGLEAQGINPHAVRVMEEAGVSLAGQRSKTLDELIESGEGAGIDWVISVCDRAERACPSLPAGNHLHQPFPDPPALAAALGGQPGTEADQLSEAQLDCYRAVRDQIRQWLELLPRRLEQVAD